MTVGVPIIGISTLDDQWCDKEKYDQSKLGLKLNINKLTEEKFETAIKSVLNENSYRENIGKLRELMFDQQQKPLDRAVWWTERVLRHCGARHQATPVGKPSVSWTQYLELQIVFMLFIVLILSLVVLYLVPSDLELLTVRCPYFN